LRSNEKAIMSCPIREEDIALYLTGDLDPESIQSVRVHLDCCSECRARLSDFKRATELVAAAWAPPAEGDFHRLRESVRSALRQQKIGRARAVWAIAASVAAGTIVVFWQGAPSSQPNIGWVQEAALTTPAAPAPWALPNLHARANTRQRTHAPAMDAGLRSVSLTTNSAGNPELRLTTADSNVVILLPMGDATHVD
jgi:anti-sigma factor RsiW